MRGQITVFIILGIMLMAGMGFMIMMVGNIQDGQLQTSLDQTQSKLFRSESARLFVQDCLLDTLDNGLILLGKGGRLFYPYSRVDFQDEVTGILYEGDQVYLAIVYDEADEPVSYPCSSSANSPAYCQWVKEDRASFGKRQRLTLDLIEDDLKTFVQEDVASCFQSMIDSGTEFSGEFNSGELTLDLEIESGGIVLSASYPLSMSIDGAEVFEIEDFDLFYPSNLYSFYNNALKNPLHSEEKNVLYNYTEQTLLLNPSYGILGASLNIDRQGKFDIYEFTTNQIHRDETVDLVYRIAIENRPPALEYVSQAACLGYDYLILPDSRSYTNLTLNASAYDPDNDPVTYALDMTSLGIDVPDTFSETPYFDDVLDVPDGEYEIVLSAYNELGYDAQTIRIRVGETTDFAVTVTDVSGNIVEDLSIEEPYFVTVETDSALFRQMDVTIDETTRSFSWTTNKFCFVIPYMSSVDCDDISNYEENMFDPFSGADFILALPATNIELGYDESLCGETVDLSRGLSFDVYSCVSKTVPSHPFPYPYHEVYINSSGGHEERVNSPFNTTTACCIDNTIADFGTVCYESEPVCQDQLRVIERSFCDGTRGNVCQSERVQEIQRSEDNIALCGDTSCGAHELCAGKEQFSYQTDVEDKKYLCTGTYGCSQVTDNLIVSSSSLFEGQSWRNELQNTNVADIEELGLYVGCVENGNSCDSDSDGILDGVCLDGVCS